MLPFTLRGIFIPYSCTLCPRAGALVILVVVGIRLHLMIWALCKCNYCIKSPRSSFSSSGHWFLHAVVHTRSANHCGEFVFDLGEGVATSDSQFLCSL